MMVVVAAVRAEHPPRAPAAAAGRAAQVLGQLDAAQLGQQRPAATYRTVPLLPDGTFGRAVVESPHHWQEALGVGAEQRRNGLGGKCAEQLGIDAGLQRYFGQVVGVLNERFTKEALRVDRAARSRDSNVLEPCPKLRIFALLQDV